MGDESIIAVAMPVTMLVAPGPDVAIATPTLPGCTRVAIGHVCGTLFMPDQDVTNREIQHRVVRRQDRAARVPEHHLDALAYEAFPENLRTSQRFFAHKLS
jgi:hypothetical protein